MRWKSYSPNPSQPLYTFQAPVPQIHVPSLIFKARRNLLRHFFKPAFCLFEALTDGSDVYFTAELPLERCVAL